MSIQTIGTDAVEPIREDARSLAARAAAGTLSILSGLARRVAAEVAYMVREDLANGRMEREPEMWER